MNKDIKVTKFVERGYTWVDIFYPRKYKLSISYKSVTANYQVEEIEEKPGNKVTFSRIANINHGMKQTVRFDSLDKGIKEDFLRFISPNITESELKQRLNMPVAELS